jgi:hypothetical protein
MGLFDFLTGVPQEAGEDVTIQKDDENTFPVVQITKVKPHVNGDRLQLYCYIQNNWGKPIELDKIQIFDTKRELDTVLRPSEARDFLVYDGPVLRREHGDVLLQYKTQEKGDYFAAEHTAKFSYRSQDDTYEVSDIQLNEPIRDIFG